MPSTTITAEILQPYVEAITQALNNNNQEQVVTAYLMFGLFLQNKFPKKAPAEFEKLVREIKDFRNITLPNLYCSELLSRARTESSMKLADEMTNQQKEVFSALSKAQIVYNILVGAERYSNTAPNLDKAEYDEPTNTLARKLAELKLPRKVEPPIMLQLPMTPPPPPTAHPDRTAATDDAATKEPATPIADALRAHANNPPLKPQVIAIYEALENENTYAAILAFTQLGEHYQRNFRRNTLQRAVEHAAHDNSFICLSLPEEKSLKLFKVIQAASAEDNQMPLPALSLGLETFHQLLINSSHNSDRLATAMAELNPDKEQVEEAMAFIKGDLIPNTPQRQKFETTIREVRTYKPKNNIENKREAAQTLAETLQTNSDMYFANCDKNKTNTDNFKKSCNAAHQKANQILTKHTDGNWVRTSGRVGFVLASIVFTGGLALLAKATYNAYKTGCFTLWRGTTGQEIANEAQRAYKAVTAPAA